MGLISISGFKFRKRFAKEVEKYGKMLDTGEIRC